MANGEHDMVVDEDGNPVPMRPEDVRAHVEKMIEEGRLVAVIVETNNQVGVQVFGPPSRGVLRILEDAAKAYRRVLKGH